MLAKIMTSGVVLIWNFLVNKLWTFKVKEKLINIPQTFPFDLSVIIPAFNEENRIKSTLLLIDDYIRNKNLKKRANPKKTGIKDKNSNHAGCPKATKIRLEKKYTLFI